MGKMLHNEARELLVESYEKTRNAEEIAKIFGVNKYTVYHCLKQSPVRFCASVNGIASAGLRLMDIACNFGNCYIFLPFGSYLFTTPKSIFNFFQKALDKPSAV